ncbi:MAG TPA: Ig-like domain-containing protein [Terriglobales bacterium]|nr:Ig-like domain-containing protein [Terriglobales bacterium]
MSTSLKQSSRGSATLQCLWIFSLLLLVFTAACGREQGALAPSLAAIAPARAVTGLAVPVVLTGANFDTGAVINVSAPVTVTATNVVSSSQITATFTTAPGAAVGPVNVSVATAGFTTNAVVYTLVPPEAVSSTTPANGSSGVPNNQVISATFTQPLACATVTAANFSVTGPGGAVAGTLGCSMFTATFSPKVLLASNATYTAVLNKAITDAAGDAMVANASWNFTTAPPPVVILTSPANGATGVPTTPTPVVATFNQNLNCATITAASYILSSAAGNVSATTSCSGAVATLNPGAALANNTLYTAQLTTAITNSFGAPMAANFSWVFRTAPGALIPPAVIATAPANGATAVPLNQILTATFNEAMDPATLNGLTFLLKATGGAAVAGTVTYNATGSVASFAPTAPLTQLTAYTATVTTGAQSLADTAMPANFNWSFTTAATPDTTKPTIISTLPANLATAVPINTSVSAVFSEPMNPATINSATFTLTPPVGPAVQALVTYAAIANTATLQPLAPLAANTQYTAKVSVAAQDLAGNPLGAGLVPNPWTFTTAAALDTTPPTIVRTSPAANAVGVALNATVNATFSEAMDPLTITNATFTLASPGGGAVAATVAYDAVNFIATLTPTNPLLANTTYTANVTNGATDVAGNPLAPGVSPNPWTFTTGASAPPTIDLRSASSFGAFAGGAALTNQGINTVINGNAGTTGASTTMTGFHDSGPGCVYTETPLNIGFVNGLIYTAPPPPTVACPTEGTAVTGQVAAQALLDAQKAYLNTSAALLPPTVAAQAPELGGLTLAPGIYQSSSGAFTLTLAGPPGASTDLTLDAQGNANATWVFEMGTSLTVGLAAVPRNVILINGAQAKNVFWHVGSAATINPSGGGTFVGTILAQTAVSTSTAGNVSLVTINGRAIVLTGSVTLVNTVINVPLP